MHEIGTKNAVSSVESTVRGPTYTTHVDTYCPPGEAKGVRLQRWSMWRLYFPRTGTTSPTRWSFLPVFNFRQSYSRLLHHSWASLCFSGWSWIHQAIHPFLIQAGGARAFCRSEPWLWRRLRPQVSSDGGHGWQLLKKGFGRGHFLPGVVAGGFVCSCMWPGLTARHLDYIAR